jgi:serine/threonine protein kinase
LRYFVHNASSRKVSVEINPKNQLGKGATAIIYKAEFNSEIVAAKIYHPDKRVNEPKISAMLLNKPDNIHIKFAGSTYPQIAWPFATLRDENGVAAGYLMPLVDLTDSFSLDYFYDQVLFKKMNAPDEVALSYKLEIAKNLSSVVASLHKNKHYFIDLKPQNIRVFRQTHIVSLVDCDGFSIADKKSSDDSRFPAELISTDYISPEAFRSKSSPKELGENQDRYALAVILFQLLNNGTHPFQGILKNDEGIATNDEKAAAGLYPYAIVPNPAIKPRPQSIHFLWDDKTRELFDRAFVGKPNERPSAEEWATHFGKLLEEKSLVRCDKEPLNIAHMRFKGKDCPSCYINNLKTFKPNSNKNTLSYPKNNVSNPNTKSMPNDELFLIFISIAIVLLFIVAIFNEKATINGNSANSSETKDPDYPSYQATEALREGWRFMDPNNEIHDYKKSYELNLKAYNLGHPEGASNIGMLYEKGWGVDQNVYRAVEWYNLALKSHFHSAQAETGLARISIESNNFDKAREYIEAAKKQLNEPLYSSYFNEDSREINLLEQKIDSNKTSSKDVQDRKKPSSNATEKSNTEALIRVELSKLNKEEFESITSTCSQSLFAGEKSYDSCILNHIKKLQQQSTNLGLDSLTEDQKNKVEIACSEDKFTNGPAAYKKCVSIQVKQFEFK